MSKELENQKRFKLIGVHRQLHADAAKHRACLEHLINESSDLDLIVEQARKIAIAVSAIEIFEEHLSAHHPAPPQAAKPRVPDPSQRRQPSPNKDLYEETAKDDALINAEEMAKQKMLAHIKKQAQNEENTEEAPLESAPAAAHAKKAKKGRGSTPGNTGNQKRR